METCATCNKPLTIHQVLFDQRIEQMQYLPMGTDFQSVCNVLYCDNLGCYCSPVCADVGITKGLLELGINRAKNSIGSATSCSKCGSLVDMTKPHVHYVSMEVTIISISGQKTMTVLYEYNLGYVCATCEPGAVLLAEADQTQPITQGKSSITHA